MSLPTTTLAIIAKLIPRLGSNHDGEVIATVQEMPPDNRRMDQERVTLRRPFSGLFGELILSAVHREDQKSRRVGMIAWAFALGGFGG